MKISYQEKAALIHEGKSRIFQNWHEHAGITQEEFLKGLEWLHDNPFYENGRRRKALGVWKGHVCALLRLYCLDGDFEGFFHAEPFFGDCRHRYSGRVILEVDDKI